MSEPYPVSETAKPASAKPGDWSCRQLNLQVLEQHGRDMLNIAPTLWAGVPLFAFFCAAAAFLEMYVVSSATTTHIVVFFVGSYVVFSSYFVCDFYMSRHSTSYARIPDDKKFYVLSNMIKSAVLLSYTPLALHVLWAALARDDWSTQRIRNLGVLYAIPDFVSLFMVKRMALTTKLHHVCVVIFMVVNLQNDYTEITVARALVVYAVFSTFAYLVNLLLASRFLQVSVRLSLAMSATALVVYAGCLCVNWTWQVIFLTRLFLGKPECRLGIVTYVCLITVVVYDDVVLCRWLKANVDRKLLERNERLPAAPTKMPTKCS